MNTRKNLFTDGEGPLVHKDLAADVTSRITFEGDGGVQVPGREVYRVLSSYDDYLTEIGTAGYQAGDTLALVVPHYLTHGLKDEDIAKEAQNAKVCLGVEDYICGLKHHGWNVRVISTAYSQMWELVGKHLNIPMEDIACTHLDLNALRKEFGSEKFNRTVRKAEGKVVSLLPLAGELMDEIDRGRPVVEVWGADTKFADLRNTLDELYWNLLPEMGYQVLEAVSVMGGRRKVDAANQFVYELGANLKDVAYVGDSITDDALNARLKREGGLPIAINGNAYALRNAVVAVASADMRRLRPVLDAWQWGGYDGVQRFVSLNGEASIPRGKEGMSMEVESGFHYDLVNPRDTEGFGKILERHKEYRKLVRGAATARLG